MFTHRGWRPLLAAGFILAAACTGPEAVTSTAAPTQTSSSPITTPTTSTPLPTTTAPVATGPDRTIGIRQIDGVAEFYVVESGDRFVPRGTNLVDTTIVEDRVNGSTPVFGILSTVVYDSDEARQHLRDMADLGYNVVRVMLEVCGTSGCISDEGEGLSDAYMDNAADFLRIAREEGVYVWYSSNTFPDRGYYSETGLAEGEADFLTPLNIEIYGDYFEDILTALSDRNAPMDNLFSFEIRNEFQFLNTYAPWSLADGTFEAANGRTYDMADPAQRRKLAEDGLLYWTDSMTNRIKQVSPTTLVSIGLLIPNEPIIVQGPDDPRFVHPGDIYDRSIVDFFDIHTGPGWPDIHVVDEQFGRSGQQDKPVVMGEFPVSRQLFPDPDLAAQQMVAWTVGSCDAGWDGWVSWHWTGDTTYWPIKGSQIGEVLAPRNHPDPCEPVDVEVNLLNFRAAATASFDGYDAETDESYPARYASDQNPETWWSADNGPPQWIEIDLGTPQPVGRIRIPIGFITPAGHTRIEVRTTDAEDRQELIHVFDADISEGDVLEFVPDVPLEGVQSIRFDITDMQGWVIIHDIEILRR